MKKLYAYIRDRALVWDSVVTTGWMTLGKGVGFMVPFFIAAWFGVTAQTDAFFFAYGFILFFSALFASVGERTVVPYIAEARSKDEDVGKLVGNILGASGIGLSVLIGVFLLLIKPFLSVVTSFDSQSRNLIYLIMLQTWPLVVFLAWASILSGALNSYKKFAFSAVSPAFRAVVNIGFIFIFKDILGIYAVALGYVAGEIARLIFLAGAIGNFKLFRLGLSFRVGPKIKEFFNTAFYQVIGVAAFSLNLFVDKIMASWLGSGSVSVLHYAERLYSIPVAFFGSGLIVAILSHWSLRYQDFGRQRLNKDLRKSIKIIFFIVVPVVLFLIIFREPIVNLAFDRGEFSQERLAEVARVWVFYLLGVVFYVLASVFAMVYVILKNTKALMKCAIYAAFLNIIFNYLLMKPLQTAGIALATSLVTVFTLIYYSSRFFKENKLSTSI
jgi:putative peptidoglycan lipid II flippase